MTLMIASETPHTRQLAAALGAELLAVPASAGSDSDWSWAQALEQWRAGTLERDCAARIVVAVWPPEHASAPLLETDMARWVERCEVAIAAWFAALGCAQALCEDGGSIVALAETPAPLDCIDWAPEVAVADAVTALAKSLARSEGARGVRVNVVTTPWRMSPAECVAPLPPLAAFPGRLDAEVVGAVRLLLAADAAGLTGTVLRADCGRSW